MVNRRYRKGYMFEWRVRRFLEAAGWVAVRCAGSKPVDIIAMRNGVILFIECKKGRSRVRREQLEVQEELARRAGARLVVVQNDLSELKKVLRELGSEP